jgi:hypothetical protein
MTRIMKTENMNMTETLLFGKRHGTSGLPGPTCMMIPLPGNPCQKKYIFVNCVKILC